MTLYYLLALVVIILVGIVMVFHKKNKHLKKEHRFKTDGLKLDLAMHDTQIQFRQTSLNSYDFLRYNLSEALVVQPRIKIQ